MQGLVHRPTDWQCRAECLCLRILEGRCSVPIGTETSLDSTGDIATLTLTGTVCWQPQLGE
jgi:hydroxymethylbilane synthase